MACMWPLRVSPISMLGRRNHDAMSETSRRECSPAYAACAWRGIQERKRSRRSPTRAQRKPSCARAEAVAGRVGVRGAARGQGSHVERCGGGLWRGCAFEMRCQSRCDGTAHVLGLCLRGAVAGAGTSRRCNEVMRSQITRGATGGRRGDGACWPSAVYLAAAHSRWLAWFDILDSDYSAVNWNRVSGYAVKPAVAVRHG